MKTIEQLNAKLADLSREDLERFARNVVISAYGVGDATSESGYALADRPHPSFDGGSVLNDIAIAELNPTEL